MVNLSHVAVDSLKEIIEKDRIITKTRNPNGAGI